MHMGLELLISRSPNHRGGLFDAGEPGYSWPGRLATRDDIIDVQFRGAVPTAMDADG
jgi:hypothetical protein